MPPLPSPAFTLNWSHYCLPSSPPSALSLCKGGFAPPTRTHNSWVLVERKGEGERQRDRERLAKETSILCSGVGGLWEAQPLGHSQPSPGASKGRSPPSQHETCLNKLWLFTPPDSFFNTLSVTWCLCALCTIQLSWYPVTNTQLLFTVE